MGFIKNVWNNRKFLFSDIKAMGSGIPANEFEISRYGKLIEHFSKYARNDIDAQFGHYDAGNTGRLQDDWGTSYATPTSNFKGQWKNIIARAISSFDNNPHTKAILNTLTSNVIGHGLRPQPRIKNKNGTPVEGLNEQLSEGWKRYNDQWDSTGRNTHYEMQKVRFGEIFRTGSTITNRVKAPKDNYLSIQNQVVNVLRLDDGHDWTTPNYSEPDAAQTVFGINMDKYGRPLSYWIQGIDKPISARYMKLHFKQEVAEQYIGVSWLTPALKYLWANESLIKDKLIASRIQAMIGLFVPDSMMTRLIKQQKNSDDQIEMKSGKIWYGKMGEKPEVVQADDSVKEVLEPLQSLLLHAIAMTFGISYQSITRDLVKTNMASGKINTNEDRKTYRMVQKWYAKEVCQHDWNEFVFRMFLEGKISGRSISDYMKDPWYYSECQWIPTGFDYIDPSREAQADIDLHENNMLTLEKYYGERGIVWTDAVEQLKKEKELLKEAGIDKPIQANEPTAKRKNNVSDRDRQD
uniref:Putative portal protein n=1 Tax=viral metagenome TaxID=1070528 RepID=A0A6M3M268_9ZZZZ